MPGSVRGSTQSEAKARVFEDPCISAARRLVCRVQQTLQRLHDALGRLAARDAQARRDRALDAWKAPARGSSASKLARVANTMSAVMGSGVPPPTP